MAADECLADEAARRDGLCVRLYSWETTTVSLGAFQRAADACRCADIAGLPLVRRPSGGGAIVHGTDLTYAAAVPKGHPWGVAPQTLYDALHSAMVDVLRDRAIAARLSPGGTPDGDGAPFLCFDRRAPGDVVVDVEGRDLKIMGSAQRRLAATVLQHGSLLLRGNPSVRAASSRVGVADLAPATWPSDTRQPATAWLERVAAVLGADVDEQAKPFHTLGGPAVAAARRRFADERWTGRR
jgi:lipoate-protein ligase A